MYCTRSRLHLRTAWTRRESELKLWRTNVRFGVISSLRRLAAARCFPSFSHESSPSRSAGSQSTTIVPSTIRSSEYKDAIRGSRHWLWCSREIKQV